MTGLFVTVEKGRTYLRGSVVADREVIQLLVAEPTRIKPVIYALDLSAGAVGVVSEITASDDLGPHILVELRAKEWIVEDVLSRRKTALFVLEFDATSGTAIVKIGFKSPGVGFDGCNCSGGKCWVCDRCQYMYCGGCANSHDCGLPK